MTRPDANPKRCTHTTRQRDGTVVECFASGGWTLDKAAKTWRPSNPTDKARRCWAHGPGSEAKPVGKGRPRKVQPNARANRVAGLLEQLAPMITLALTECSDELSLLGFPGSSNRGTNYLADDDASDPVGDDAQRIVELTDWREQVRDVLGELESGVDELVRLVAVVLKRRHAHGVKLCNENQQGRQGSIEWGRSWCTELPTKSGLCHACYHRERRWRQEHDLPTGIEDAA